MPLFNTFGDITNQDVKDWHGYISSDKDTQITMARSTVASYIENICHHDFESKARANEKPRIRPRQIYFFLKHRPVASVQSLTEDGVTLTEGTDYWVDPDTGRVEKIRDHGSVFNSSNYLGYWNSYPDKVVVNYTAGDALTDDIIEVFFELIGIKMGLKTKTFIDEEGIERVVTLKTLSPDLKEILTMHRHVRLGER